MFLSDAPALPKLLGSCSIKDWKHQTLQIRVAVALARQRHTGWVQRMNNSLPCGQTLCCETNIQQHLCAWRKEKRFFSRGRTSAQHHLDCAFSKLSEYRYPWQEWQIAPAEAEFSVRHLCWTGPGIIGNIIRTGYQTWQKCSWYWTMILN